MATGVVKWFNATKGFGFITPDLGPCDVFVHVSALVAARIARLEPGDRIEFELTQGGDGRLLALGLRRPTVPPDAPDNPEATSGAERRS
jgi:cold shock CspA family protein